MMERSRAEQGSPNEEDSKFYVAAPELTIPKGGGAIRGIGEKFGVNPVNGTGSITVPVYASPGRSGFGPQLSLTYDSGNGNGPFGFGWSLDVNAITRKTDKGLPQYADTEESDVFLLSSAEDLMPALVETKGKWTRDIVPARTVYGKQYDIHRYRPRVEGSFARIERWINTADPQDTFWRTIAKDNSTTWYGRTSESRIADPADPSRIFSWLICESHDDKGNVISYQYKLEDSTGVDLTRAHERNRSNTTRSVKRYLKNIFYGNRTPYFPDLTQPTPVALPTDWCFQLVFDFGEHDLDKPTPQDSGQWACRLDPFSQYRSTFEVRTYRLCRRILMFHNFAQEPNVGLNCLVRSTDLTYAHPSTDPTKPFYSYLLSVTQRGYRRDGEQGYLSNSLPPLEFEYTEAIVDETVWEVDRQSLENLPYGLDGSKYRWADLDGEGLSGILTEQGTGWFYKANLSPINRQQINGSEVTLAQFAAVEAVAHKPSLAALSHYSQQLLDLSGNGQLDLVDFRGATPGFFERTPHANWEPFKAFQSLPVLDWRNPNLRFIDLTGDGLLDLLVSEENVFCWHASLGVEGFDREQRVPQALDEEKGPKVIFSDSTETMFLADMSGDGLTDLVRIRNGEVCYWPNLGYGRFGARVAMDQAPLFDRPELFDARRIRLSDIDGTGTADIIYFAAGGADLYFNASGNAYGERYTLDHFPSIENLSSATVLDLLGNGTACLVWSSPLAGNARRPMRYIDLMSGQKPHLLVRVRNNLGAETVVQYAPSTKFYVADKVAGTPWVTRLPFPVHVVEQVQTYDYVSRNLFVSRYAYHHGYFDGVEREFRGFGRVDQWDTEEFATLSSSSDFPQAVNVDATSHVPPVWTKTWFHTGAFFEKARISRHLEHEYYSESDATEGIPDLTRAQLASLLPDDTILPTNILLLDGSRIAYDLSGEEMREACRAFRGSMIRQEIYALDGTDESDRPYSVAEHNFTIEMLQPQGPNRYGTFLVHPRESVDLHYERKLYTVTGNTLVDQSAPPSTQSAADPRVTHSVVLTADPYGNVLEALSIGYGRRYLDPGLSTADQAKQSTLLATYTRNTYTNPVLEDDDYRLPLAAQTTAYELLQIQPAANQPNVTNLFRFGELQMAVQAASDGAHDIPFENVNPTGLNAGQPYRRLIACTRTYYRPDDMGATAGDPRALLPLGQLQSLALPGVSYRLAFTPGLITQVYQRGGTALLPAPASVLGSVPGDGGYQDVDVDGRFWVPSGRPFYLPTLPTSPQELNQARASFFLPRRYEDAFGNATTIDYDPPHYLLGTKRTDAVNNVISSVNDYRVLAPTILTDPNGNQAAVRFDALGMVVGTAMMGKVAQGLGDSLTGFTADLTQGQVDGFFGANDLHTLAAPLLGNATTRLVYDVSRFYHTRMAFPNDPTQWQPTFGATLARETHVSDLAQGQQSKIQISFSYSDGFGREIQKKIQAEPGPLVEGGPESNPRWVGSGWTIFNNRGKPVRQYEPFFSATQQFEFAMQVGVSPVLFYDPVERVVATLHPNHTYEKVIFDPWKQTSWDVNDTVLLDSKTDPDVGNFFQCLPDVDYRPTWYEQRQGGALGAQEQAAAQKTAVHANTPTVACFDTLGRVFLTVEHNRFVLNNAPPVDKYYVSRSVLDIQGKQRAVSDARDRVVMRYDYEMLGGHIRQASQEAGERWILNDVSGKTIRAWDSRGHTLRTVYEKLHRPLEVYLSEDNGNSWMLVERTVYGESQPNPEQQNLRGKLYQAYDQAGLVTTGSYDFKGNLLSGSRQLVDNNNRSYTGGTADWAIDWSMAIPLETQSYTSSTTYDALNRPVTLTAPDTSVIRHVYNEANLLEQVTANVGGAVTAISFVSNIDYNAKGQRTLIEYGNGANTQYEYDPQTFRLIHLFTTRGTGFPGDGTDPTNAPAGVQDLRYTYDPVGNITHIQDDAQQTIYFRNQCVEPGADYTYDAIYRLIEASGREHLAQGGGSSLAPVALTYDDRPRMGILQPGDGTAMGRYSQQYTYDEVGNILQMLHSGTDPTNPGWTCTYAYNEPSLLEAGKVSNRLSSTQIGGGPAEPYTYDPHGNMAAMSHLSFMKWDYKDQLQATAQQVVTNGGTPEITYYVYDATGQRVRKVTERQAAQGQTPTRLKERIYLGGFEIYREYGGDGSTITLERESLHVMNNKQRIALVETRTQGSDNSPQQLIRYQFSNHLDTACLELDDQAQIITYEEYYPFGSTSYQAVRNRTETPKRYRYTGKERDEENELYYHGARYYAPWLGRWMSCDPKFLVDGPNLYRYCKDSPTNLVDPKGTAPKGASEGSVLMGTVDPTLDKKGIGYNTETKVEITLKDGTVGVRRFDRFYQDPNGNWTGIEAKGANPEEMTDNEKLLDKRIQTEGARFRVIQSAGDPPPGHGEYRADIAFTKDFVGELKPGYLMWVTGSVGHEATDTQPFQASASVWKRAMEASFKDAPGHEGMVRKVNINGAPTWITQEQAAADYKKLTGRELFPDPVSNAIGYLQVKPKDAFLSQSATHPGMSHQIIAGTVVAIPIATAPLWVPPVAEAVPTGARIAVEANQVRVAVEQVGGPRVVAAEEALEEAGEEVAKKTLKMAWDWISE